MIVGTIIQIRCDGCGIAYIYPPEGKVAAFLLAAGWATNDGLHHCPVCIRRAK